MASVLSSVLFRPPLRLRHLAAPWVKLLRALWMLTFVLSIAAVAVGTMVALRDTYETRPEFVALGLDYDVADNGEVRVELIGARPTFAGRDFGITTINGSPVRRDERAPALAARLKQAGQTVSLQLRDDRGATFELSRPRDISAATPDAKRARTMRLIARLVSGILACGTLLLCSFLLVRRRPYDPVALLFGFAFTGMAATIDPPIAMWMAIGWPPIYDVISSVWFYLLLIALAVFPDGIFVPKPFRWLLLLGIPLAIFVSLPSVNPNIQVVVGVAALLSMLLGQARRYRRLNLGIERQQIKWAGFGFAAGLLLVLTAFMLLSLQPTDSARQSMIVNMAIVMLFSLGMAVIPLGLLVALTRFRLWEADTVISRSAAYALVTVVVGVVWAASSDLVKMIVEQVVGRESQAGATAVSAMIAAGIFAPAQSVVLGWTRRRFGNPVEQIHESARRLKSWGLTEPPGEVATRALAIIDQAIHPAASAIVLDMAMGRELIAAREVDSADDPRLIERLTLADEESSVGTLLLGRRSDGNRYNRLELEALDEIIPPLAEALRVARSRYSRENMMQQRLDEMAERLAQLEGGAPKPA